MSLRQDYCTSVATEAARRSDTAALPSILVRVCADILGVDGAGLSVSAELRLPLAATSGDVAAAERLQVTLGDGPCLEALQRQQPVAVTATQMAAKWPLYASELLRRTPFRSVASVPLTSGDLAVGAMDLYSVHPDAPFGNLDDIVDSVAQPVSVALLGQAGWLPALSGSPDLTTSVGRRLGVWVAVGMVMDDLGLEASDALATLRGYAYLHGLDLDTLADFLVVQTLTPNQLLDRGR